MGIDGAAEEDAGDATADEEGDAVSGAAALHEARASARPNTVAANWSWRIGSSQRVRRAKVTRPPRAPLPYLPPCSAHPGPMRHDRPVTTTEPITQPSRPRSAAGRRLDELAFLHEIARLATQARDWDELMRTIVDGTTAAMSVEVCSFYLSDRDADRLTLAATNGLDRSQVGRVSLAVGQGITGRAAASRLPIAVRDVTADRRFSWVRGFDMRGLHAMLSVPLVWHEEVVGVLNVQTLAKRNFRRAEIEFLTTIAALLAGIVAKGRLQAEIEGRLQQLTALDAARAELLSVVTHELRTPLSVVRGVRRPPRRGSRRDESQPNGGQRTRVA